MESEEDFEKLPKWKQWVFTRWWIPPIASFVIVVVVTIILKTLGII